MIKDTLDYDNFIRFVKDTNITTDFLEHENDEDFKALAEKAWNELLL